MSIVVRQYHPSDLAPIARLYYDTVHRINAADYSPEQIAAWAPTIYPEAYWRKRFARYRVFVAVRDGNIAGFAEFDPCGHIDCFYVHHACQRRGAGRALLRQIETETRAAEASRLHANVSTTARPFFVAMGFHVVREQTERYRGCDFQQFLMEKHLSMSPPRNGFRSCPRN